jgi:[acyl-carrier-protein] S-malonyltransferase
MQQAVPEGQGSMAAIMAPAEEVLTLCREAAENDVLSPANFNAPGQVVVAGHTVAVDRVVALAQERKLRAMPLKVSAPFHCTLMAPAARAMEHALSEVEISTARIPVVTNVEASPNTDAERTAELLVQQVDSPVRWEQAIQFMAAQGVARAIEIGPGRVLAGLVRRIDKRIKVLSVGDPQSLEKVKEFLS